MKDQLPFALYRFGEDIIEYIIIHVSLSVTSVDISAFFSSLPDRQFNGDPGIFTFSAFDYKPASVITYDTVTDA